MIRSVRVLFCRTIARLLTSPSTSVIMAAFVSVSAACFVRAISSGEGASLCLEALWASSAVPFLPVICALFTMRLVADEKSSGVMDVLFSSPVREREIIFGKYFATFAMMLVTLFAYLTIPVIVLPLCAPSLSAHVSLLSFVPAVAALAMQGALWCAIGLFASTLYKNSALSAFTALILMVVVPRAAFELAIAWSPILRMKLLALPFESHIVDLATGFVNLPTISFYFVLTLFTLFASVKILASLRYRGRFAFFSRFPFIFVILLAFIFSCLFSMVANRLDLSFEIPLRSSTASASARTRQILSEMHGDVRVTCFMPRKSPEFRAVSRLLRGLAATARSVAGTTIDVEYVDPRWELGRAIEVVRNGVEEGTIVFRRRNRRIKVAVSDLFETSTNEVVTIGSGAVFNGETVCASALQRLSLPARKEVVYWTSGHGENTFASYDPVSGMSDIARELRRDGYHLEELDLSSSPAVPGDCSVLVVSGAREAFSRIELSRIEGWMRTGGRLLVLSSNIPNSGVGTFLSSVGVKILPYTVLSSRTVSGSDVVVREFADHAITHPLIGSTVLFSFASPVSVSSASLNNATTYAELLKSDDRSWGETDLNIRPWARDAASEPSGPFALAVAIERGGEVSKDVALHPMRCVVIGDASFVSNGALSTRGNANRDVFMNSVAWLAGLDAITPSRASGKIIETGMDRDAQKRFMILSCVAPSLVIIFFGLIISYLRRRDA